MVADGSLIPPMTTISNGCRTRMALQMTLFARWLLLMLCFKAVILARVFMTGVTAIQVRWEVMVAVLPNGFAVTIHNPTIPSAMELQ